MMKPKIKVSILERSYQRNGICGEPFEVVKFHLQEGGDDGGTLIATIRGNDKLKAETCRVIDPTNLSSHWRGDVLGYELIKVLRKSDRHVKKEKNI